jgi:hypothetical protein
MNPLEFNIWFNIGATLLSTVAVIALDALTAILINIFVKKKLNTKSKFFVVSKKEKNFLQKLGIKKYKAYLPDLGKLGGFAKNKIEDPNSKEYIGAYILESCAGEITHIISLVLGIVIIFIFPLKYMMCFGFPVFVVNFFLNLMPIMALRYNRYQLSVVYARLQKKESNIIKEN